MEGDNGASEQLRTPLLPENAMDNINATSNTSSDGDDANCPDVSSTAAAVAADGIMRTAATTTTIVDASDNNNNDSGWFLSNPQQLTAMLSNYSTSYNVVNISLVLPILEELYDGDSEDAAACASSLLAGMIIGQLVGGALGDSMLGRLGALRLVMALQLIASLASASVTGSSGDEIYVKLALWRFILGVGAGGVYPLAAVLSAEQSMPSSSSSSNSNNNNDDHDDKSSSVHRVVLTFSTQGAGFVTVPIVAVILLHTIQNLNLIWRIMLGLGSIPGIILMILQWRLYSSSSSSYHNTAALQAVPLEEPATTTEAVEDEDATPAADTFNDDSEEQHNNNNNNNNNHTITLQEDEVGMSQQQRQQRVGWLTAIRNEPGLGRKVIGTAGTWFLFDVVFYGNAIFQPIVVEAAFGGRSSSGGSSLELLRQAAMDTLILTSIALPGYAVAGLVIGKKTCCVTQTPRYVMLQGFAAMSVLYVSIGLNWSYLRHSPALLVFLYGMTFFFANYGPNTCTFILPSLLYSPECRSTWNGISAASGKLGALLGATLFAPAADEWGDNSVMLICAGLAVLAFVLTYCFVPKGEEEIIINRSIVATEEEEHERSDDRSSPLNEADRWT